MYILQKKIIFYLFHLCTKLTGSKVKCLWLQTLLSRSVSYKHLGKTKKRKLIIIDIKVGNKLPTSF